MSQTDATGSGGPANAEHLVVLCTVPDAEQATRLADAVVGEGLAACVNRIEGLWSTFRWEDAVQRETEVLLIIKTRAERFDALAARLKELHPYEVPEVIALPVVAGLAPYLAWIDGSLA